MKYTKEIPTTEQLAKEFSKGNPATEAAFLAGAKQARLQDLGIVKFEMQVNLGCDAEFYAIAECAKKIEELL